MIKKVTTINPEIYNKSSGIFTDQFENVLYLKNGKFHRTNGPAVYNHLSGWEEYFIFGFRHRIDGPAISNSVLLHQNDSWYYYDIKAESKEQFYDIEWRKRIEIERFL